MKERVAQNAWKEKLRHTLVMIEAKMGALALVPSSVLRHPLEIVKIFSPLAATSG